MLKFIILSMLFFNNLALATTDTVKVYKYTAANGTVTFTDKKPANQTYKTLLFTCYACAVNSDINWHNTPLFQDKYQSEITAASKTHQIPQALIRAVIHAESAFKPDAISKTGAIGLMQLMPQTAKQLGVSKPQQVAANIDGGTKYLAQMLKQFQGNIQLATAAYNAGPTAVKKYNRIPPYPETKAYVERVKILHRRYRL